MERLSSNISPSPQQTTLRSEVGGPASSARAADHGTIKRSCLVCHRRKIRCNKKLPCSNCVRGNSQCHYPGPDRPARKPHKLTINHLDARLARLERTIDSLSMPVSEASGDLQCLAPLDDMDLDKAAPRKDGEEGVGSEGTQEGSETEELLVENGDSSRYVNDILLSRILEEEQELQSALGSPRISDTHAVMDASAQLGPILSNFHVPSPESPNRHPSARQGAQLWRAFVSNVDPVAKVLHIPTMEVAFFAASNDPRHIAHDLSALLFAIYLGAIASLEENDVMNILGQSRGTALSTYKIGLEQSLAAANFLETPSMESLQAMVLYINALRAFNAGRSVWTLLGLTIRSAQSIGLHRDGTNFKLSPFKTEMRRRLWWFLLSRELRAVEDHGLDIRGSETISDTKIPSNVEDSDLFPEMEEIPASKFRWTGMSPCLAIIEMANTLPRLYKASSMPGDASSGRAAAEKLLQDLQRRLSSTYLKHCDPNIPLQRSVMLLIKMMMAKNAFVIQQQYIHRAGLTGSSSPATEEEYLIETCEILEMDTQLKTDDILRDFHYTLRTYTQYHSPTYMLWHLCVKPIGPTTDRAWAVIDKQFEIAAESRIASQGRSKWTIIEVLRQKALRIRNSLRQESNAPESNGALLPKQPAKLPRRYLAHYYPRTASPE